MHPLMLTLLAACAPGYLLPDTGLPPSGDTADTGAPDTAETGSGGGDTDPPNTMEFWRGTRDYSYDVDEGSCYETVNDDGRLIASDHPDLPGLQEACPTCEWFYRIRVEPSFICDWIQLADEVVRAISLDGTQAVLYNFSEGMGHAWEAEALDDAATFEGTSLDFRYESDMGWGIITTEGHAELTTE